MFRKEFHGLARVEKTVIDLAKGLAEAKLSPQDLSNPVSFQIAFSKLYEALMKIMEGGGKSSYVAEVRFRDSLGNLISFAVDLGSQPPPFSSREVRARIVVEFLEDV
ncbi:MAG: hypothetical protein DRO09_00760 [Thermoprotei archaeon]|nr:MAG: hypothetical protein DRO09_00760 [Thermoprotei archaeon]